VALLTPTARAGIEKPNQDQALARPSAANFGLFPPAAAVFVEIIPQNRYLQIPPTPFFGCPTAYPLEGRGIP
jgi:hypothetical protein